MWIYSQRTGDLWSPIGFLAAKGYSGAGEGKNNPKLEAVKNVGPIPKGEYVVGDPYNHISLGKYILPLMPNGHDCLGRSHFRIHGYSSEYPYDSSEGCPIFEKRIRVLMHESKDRIFVVIE